MKRMKIVCHCGRVFTCVRLFNEHRALHNVRWPRSDPSDEHGIREVIGGENGSNNTTSEEK